MEQPIHKHDCDNCVFLGTFKGNDLYYCKQGSRDTVIARYGVDADYESGLMFANRTNSPLWVAKLRAQARGLLSISD